MFGGSQVLSLYCTVAEEKKWVIRESSAHQVWILIHLNQVVHRQGEIEAAVEILLCLFNTNLVMSKNPGDHFLLVEGATLPHFGVGLSENRTNHRHLYFQSVMSFPSVLTNPLHQHLSHGQEGVQRTRAENRPENIGSVFGPDIYFSSWMLYTFTPWYFMNESDWEEV